MTEMMQNFLNELYKELQLEKERVAACPTNGEKLKELFPDVTMYQLKSGILLDVTSNWWNEKYRR